MTPTDFEQLVAAALRATTGRIDATILIEAAAAGGIGGPGEPDLVALVASWVTAALDPDGAHAPAPLGLGWPTAGFPVFRLAGLEAAAHREAHQ